MSKLNRATFLDNFEKFLPGFENLKTAAFGIVATTLRKHDVVVANLESRIKDSESAYQKAQSKSYADTFSEMTDFVGIRIIVYLDRDIDVVDKALREVFDIDEDNSVDKRTPEKVDVVGYRSLHLVCRLGANRNGLVEYDNICEQSFEIQIRSALQHAWAQIEHKRRYKGAASLPAELQHRLMALAGTLELVDREFSSIATDAEAYVAGLTTYGPSETGTDLLSTVAIEALTSKFVDTHQFVTVKTNPGVSDINKVQGELIGFGVKTVNDFKSLLESIDIEKLEKTLPRKRQLKMISFLRLVMMIHDVDKYFSDAFKDSFGSIDAEHFKPLAKTLGEEKMTNLFMANNVELIPF